MPKKIKIADAGAPDDFIQDVIDLCGQDTADRFLAEFAGQQIYICSAENLHLNSKLALAVGYDNAYRICSELIAYGFGIHIVVPVSSFSNANRNLEQTFILTEDGLSANQIAKQLGICRRTVFQYRAKLKALGKLPCK